MNSTDEERLTSYWEQEICRVADSLRARGVTFFAMGPTAADSWYTAVPADLPEFVEVEAETAERDLRAMWEAQGLPELAGLAEGLMRLASELQQDEEQSAELSPFVYVMY